MSILFAGGSGHAIQRTSALDADGAYTIMNWVYITAFGGDSGYQTLIYLGDSGGNFYDGLWTETSNYWYGYCARSSLNSSWTPSVGPSLDTWYHVAQTRDSAGNDLYWYINGVQYGGGFAQGAITGEILSNHYDSDDEIYGRQCCWKAWTAELSQAEIQQEMYSQWPVTNLSSLWGWWPLLNSGDLADYSGNGRDFAAETGGFTTAHGPPIPFTRDEASGLYIPESDISVSGTPVDDGSFADQQLTRSVDVGTSPDVVYFVLNLADNVAADRTISTVVYGGQSCSQVFFSDQWRSFTNLYVFRLANPPTGSNTLTVTTTGANPQTGFIGAIAFSGTDGTEGTPVGNIQTTDLPSVNLAAPTGLDRLFAFTLASSRHAVTSYQGLEWMDGYDLSSDDHAHFIRLNAANPIWTMYHAIDPARAHISVAMLLNEGAAEAAELDSWRSSMLCFGSPYFGPTLPLEAS